MYNLRNSGLDVMLVEQNKIGQSTSGNNTGKLNYLQNDLLDKIRTNFDDKTALKYIKAQQDAIEMIVQTITKENIKCDLQQVDSFLYTNKISEIKKIKDLERFLSRNGIDVTEANKRSLKFLKRKYMIKVSDTYVFHPIKYIYGLLKNNKFPVYENTSIKRVEKIKDYYICSADKYKIKAKWVVIASHYPYFNIPYLFPIKASLEKSYLSASETIARPFSLISYSKPVISMRNYKDYLIYLSNSRSLESNVDDKNNFEELQKKVSDLKLKPSYLWSNIDIITNDGLPYIGRLKDNLLIATGYNTWGLTNGSLAGRILSDIITNKENEYIELFNPRRMNFAKVFGVFSNIYKNIIGFIKGYIVKNSKVLYAKKNNKKVMIYKDKEEHIVNRKCPHFGCGLIFNEVEKTWDCPCHGSRFDIVGKCISGPANEDIGYNNN